ncbi:unnamed protein product [Sympodiomycopsis kandeliae]
MRFTILTSILGLAALAFALPSSDGSHRFDARQQPTLKCEKPAGSPSGTLYFQANEVDYTLGLSNQSILAEKDTNTKWEFRACSLPSNKPATLGYPPETSGHVTLASDNGLPICLHADYEREILDFKPCNYLDNSGQQEFYWLYDPKNDAVRLAGQPASEKKPIWKLTLGSGRPPNIAVKPRGKHNKEPSIVFAFKE